MTDSELDAWRHNGDTWTQRLIARLDLERNRADHEHLRADIQMHGAIAARAEAESLAGLVERTEEKLHAAEAEVARLVEVANRLTGERNEARDEVARAKLNTRRMALLAEMFVYEPNRLSEGGLLAQVQRALTDQDVEYDGLAALSAPPDPKEPSE